MVEEPFIIVASAMHVFTDWARMWEANMPANALHTSAADVCVVTLMRTSRVSDERR
jgi:hypothetical protein